MVLPLELQLLCSQVPLNVKLPHAGLNVKRQAILVTLCLTALPRPASPTLAGRHFEYVAVLRENERSKVLGFASMIPTVTNTATDVTVTLEKEKVGTVRTWQVRRGTCAAPGAVWGDSTVFQPLTVSRKGVSKRNVVVAIPLPDLGDFHIRIDAARGKPKKVFICSDFYVDD